MAFQGLVEISTVFISVSNRLSTGRKVVHCLGRLWEGASIWLEGCSWASRHDEIEKWSFVRFEPSVAQDVYLFQMNEWLWSHSFDSLGIICVRGWNNSKD